MSLLLLNTFCDNRYCKNKNKNKKKRTFNPILLHSIPVIEMIIDSKDQAPLLLSGNFAVLSQSIRCKTTFNRDLVTRVFSRFMQFARFYFVFSFAFCDIFFLFWLTVLITLVLALQLSIQKSSVIISACCRTSHSGTHIFVTVIYLICFYLRFYLSLRAFMHRPLSFLMSWNLWWVNGEQVEEGEWRPKWLKGGYMYMQLVIESQWLYFVL